jgi:hypothetical protein
VRNDTETSLSFSVALRPRHPSSLRSYYGPIGTQLVLKKFYITGRTLQLLQYRIVDVLSSSY